MSLSPTKSLYSSTLVGIRASKNRPQQPLHVSSATQLPSIKNSRMSSRQQLTYRMRDDSTNIALAKDSVLQSKGNNSVKHSTLSHVPLPRSDSKGSRL